MRGSGGGIHSVISVSTKYSLGLPWWLSGLRTWHCHGCSSGHCYGVALISGPGTACFRLGKHTHTHTHTQALSWLQLRALLWRGFDLWPRNCMLQARQTHTHTHTHTNRAKLEIPSSDPVFALNCSGLGPGGMQGAPLAYIPEIQPYPNTSLCLDGSVCYANMILLCTRL